MVVYRCILFLAALTLASGAPIPVTNGTFEAPPGGPGNQLVFKAPANWVTSGNAGYCHCRSQSNLKSFEGGYAGFAQTGGYLTNLGAGGQSLGVLQDRYVYTVTVQVATGGGKPQQGGGGGSYDVALYAGGVRLDGRTGTIEAGNVWQTVTFEYRATSSYVGQPIELRLGGVSGTVFFDAVELSYAAVPEPVSAVLTGTAAAVLAFVAARRRRKSVS